MNSQITAVAKDDGVGILAIAVVTNNTLGVWLVTRTQRLTINSSSRT